MQSMLIRREAFEKAGNFNETFRQGGDYDFVLVVRAVASFFVPSPLKGAVHQLVAKGPQRALRPRPWY